MVWNLPEGSHLTLPFPAFPAPGHPQAFPNLPSAASKSGPLSQELGLKKLLVDQQRRCDRQTPPEDHNSAVI